MISTTAHLEDGREVIVRGYLTPPEYDVGIMGYGVEDTRVYDAQTEEEIEFDEKEEQRLVDILISDWQKSERWH
jgi:hypothetical protein